MKNTSENLFRAAVWTAAALTALLFIYLTAFILIKGIPHIKPGLFSPVYTSENVSLLPALISTVEMTFLSLVIAAPLGIFAAVWLVEYASRRALPPDSADGRHPFRRAIRRRLYSFSGSLAAFVRITAETLAGIPSIVYGLFGLLFFVGSLNWGFSVLAGAFTLSLMILPLVLRSAEEALRAVPASWREGAYSLGAGKLRMIFRVAVPAAAPGILAGIIIAIGRITGETAALIYTAGTVAQIPETPAQSARTLAVHVYALSGEGLHTGEAYASAAVLLVVIAGINTAAAALARNISGKRKERER